MKTLTVGLGILTILAVTGAMTPSGQAMLGLRPSPATSSVHVIKDTTQPAANTPAPSAAAESNMPAAKPAVGPQARQTRPVAARSAARPVTARPSAVPAQRSASYPAPSAPPTVQAGPQTGASPFPGGLSSAGSVANILLNLPQVLQQTQVGPFGGNSSGDSSQGQDWRYRHAPQGQQWKHGGGDDEQQGTH